MIGCLLSVPHNHIVYTNVSYVKSSLHTNITLPIGRPGGSVGNLENFWRWKVTSNLGVVTRTGTFLKQNEKNKNKYKNTKIPNKWRTVHSLVHLVHNIRLHGRRGKWTTESFSRKKLRYAPQKEGWEILCHLPPVWPPLVRPQTWRPE